MNAKIPLSHIHFCLVSLTYYNSNVWAAEESIIEDFNFKGLLKREWGTDILSDNSFKGLVKFREKWLTYKESVNYAGDTVFMYFDKNWIKIINVYLLPAIESMESDMASHKIEFVSYRNHYDPLKKPTIDNILERGNTLYKLLLDAKIVTKSYTE